MNADKSKLSVKEKINYKKIEKRAMDLLADSLKDIGIDSRPISKPQQIINTATICQLSSKEFNRNPLKCLEEILIEHEQGKNLKEMLETEKPDEQYRTISSMNKLLFSSRDDIKLLLTQES